MRVILDTHIAIWAALDPKALRHAEHSHLAQAEGPVVLSAVSIWELRLKWHSLRVSGERKGPVGPASVVTFVAAMRWELLSLTARHASTELTQALKHKDPFDELLLVQAQVEDMRLLSRDAKLAHHPLVLSGEL